MSKLNPHQKVTLKTQLKVHIGNYIDNTNGKYTTNPHIKFHDNITSETNLNIQIGNSHSKPIEHLH